MEFDAKKYPIITAEIISKDETPDQIYLYNSETNRGFVLDGLAASFCVSLEGEQTLEQVINKFRAENELSDDEFEEEIYALLIEMFTNELMVFRDIPLSQKKHEV